MTGYDMNYEAYFQHLGGIGQVLEDASGEVASQSGDMGMWILAMFMAIIIIVLLIIFVLRPYYLQK